MATKKNTDKDCNGSGPLPSTAYVVITRSDFQHLLKEIREALASNSKTELPLLVTGPEMAKLLSVSFHHLDRVRSEGLVPSVRIGKSRRYSPSDVLAAIKEAGE
ncbi:helix-turn-helix domain-containing protein [Rhodopirellula europaea]|uniref:helix-turn-helix domain-containing protein n=1 Tax=Rhodopirellula europaea TaxID=1263866 RepID=UPI003D2C175D